MWVITLPTKIKKTFKSIRFKFILAYLLIIVLAFGFIGTVTIQLVGDNLYRREGEDRLGCLRAASIGVNRALRENDYLGAYESCLETANACRGRLFVIDENGRVMTDTLSLMNGRSFDVSLEGSIHRGLLKADSSSDTYSGLFPDRNETYVFLRADRYPDLTADETSGRVTLASVPLEGGRVLAGVFGADVVRSEIEGIALWLVLSLAGLFAVALLLGFIVTRSYTKPVKELSEAITKLSSGDFSVRVSEKGSNELSDLSRAFNEMTGRMEMLDRSRNQFVSNASHELKTPLATIKIMVQTLLFQEVYDEAMSKEFLTDVDKEIDRLNAVVSDLLTLVGMDSGESKLNMEDFSLSDMIRDDVKRLSPLARERGVELELSAVPSMEICGDRIKLDQVFYNLIDNAIKYTPRGAGVKVELSSRNRSAVIRVKDNGIGIPEADQKHIFDRFYRVDKARSRETGGTGLGLSIAKQIILAHNGTINVSSKVDEGSVFTVTLPLGSKGAGRQGA